MANEPAIRLGMGRLIARLGLVAREARAGNTAAFQSAETIAALLLVEHAGVGAEPAAIAVARQLRTDPKVRFCAPILLLAFGDAEFQRWGGAFADASVHLVRLPCTAAEVGQALGDARPLPPAVWDRIAKRLRRQVVAERASALRHRLDGHWSSALTALIDLEKLAHFVAPDVDRLARHHTTIRNAFHADLLAAVAREVLLLLAEATEVGMACMPDATARVRSGIAAAGNAACVLGDLAGLALAASARGAREALQTVLDEVSRVHHALQHDNSNGE